MSINTNSTCIATQYHYIEPFSEDNIDNIGTVNKIFNLFVKRGNGNVGTQTRRHTSQQIGSVLPNVSGRVYDYTNLDFSGTWDGGVNVAFTGGNVFINNIFLEIGSFTINVFTSPNHWRLQNDGEWGYDATNVWGFPTDGTGYGTICLYYKPYVTGENTVTDTSAEIMMVEPSAVDFEFMAPIIHIQAIRTSGNVDAVNLLFEHTAIADYPIEQIGYWRDFLIDGGLLE